MAEVEFQPICMRILRVAIQCGEMVLIASENWFDWLKGSIFSWVFERSKAKHFIPPGLNTSKCKWLFSTPVLVGCGMHFPASLAHFCHIKSYSIYCHLPEGHFTNTVHSLVFVCFAFFAFVCFFVCACALILQKGSAHNASVKRLLLWTMVSRANAQNSKHEIGFICI